MAEEQTSRHVDDGHTVLEQKLHQAIHRLGLVPFPPPWGRQRRRLTQAESAKDTSGKLMVK